MTLHRRDIISVNATVCVHVANQHIHAGGEIVKGRAGDVLHSIESNDEMLSVHYAPKVYGDLIRIGSNNGNADDGGALRFGGSASDSDVLIEGIDKSGKVVRTPGPAFDARSAAGRQQDVEGASRAVSFPRHETRRRAGITRGNDVTIGEAKRVGHLVIERCCSPARPDGVGGLGNGREKTNDGIAWL